MVSTRGVTRGVSGAEALSEDADAGVMELEVSGVFDASGASGAGVEASGMEVSPAGTGTRASTEGLASGEGVVVFGVVLVLGVGLRVSLSIIILLYHKHYD